MGVAPYGGSEKLESEQEPMIVDTAATRHPRFSVGKASVVVLITVAVGVACLGFGIPALGASLIGAGVASAVVTLGSSNSKRRGLA